MQIVALTFSVHIKSDFPIAFNFFPQGSGILVTEDGTCFQGQLSSGPTLNGKVEDRFIVLEQTMWSELPEICSQSTVDCSTRVSS